MRMTRDNLCRDLQLNYTCKEPGSKEGPMGQAMDM